MCLTQSCEVLLSQCQFILFPPTFVLSAHRINNNCIMFHLMPFGYSKPHSRPQTESCRRRPLSEILWSGPPLFDLRHVQMSCRIRRIESGAIRHMFDPVKVSIDVKAACIEKPLIQKAGRGPYPDCPARSTLHGLSICFVITERMTRLTDFHQNVHKSIS